MENRAFPERKDQGTNPGQVPCLVAPTRYRKGHLYAELCVRQSTIQHLQNAPSVESNGMREVIGTREDTLGVHVAGDAHVVDRKVLLANRRLKCKCIGILCYVPVDRCSSMTLVRKLGRV